MTQDQTVTNGAQSDQSPDGERAGDLGAAVLRAADGAHIPVPPDLPAMARQHEAAAQLADSVISVLGRVDLDRALAFEEVARAALGQGELEPGGVVYAAHARVAALVAFRRVLLSAQTRIQTARTASRPDAAPQGAPQDAPKDGPQEGAGRDGER